MNAREKQQYNARENNILMRKKTEEKTREFRAALAHIENWIYLYVRANTNV